MSTTGRIFAARLAGLAVFDPVGERVGTVRDVVLIPHGDGNRPQARGLVVEVPGRRRVFMPMQRVTSMKSGQVISTGVIDLRRFATHETEQLAIADVLERQVSLADGAPAVVEDLAMERSPRGAWIVNKVFVRRGTVRRGIGARFRRRGETLLVDVNEVKGLTGRPEDQGVSIMLASFANLKAADIAELLHDMSVRRRAELAAELDDERLADVLEELPDDDQVQIINYLDTSRAAEVLEAMQPDDAADLLGELDPDLQERLLLAMDDEEAADVRRLLAYDENTAGGLMTTDPVILGPEASVAEGLALARREDVSPALSAAIYVTRSPHDTPTGRFVGTVHLQRMLREPPHLPIGSLIDKAIEPLEPNDTLSLITRRLATYNLVSLPVTDENDHLLGAVTIDDVLDHLLPDDWREHGEDVEDEDLDDEPGYRGRPAPVAQVTGSPGPGLSGADPSGRGTSRG
ncbi:MAG: magnesium transporter MgtE N-terminal domain-containing protein [Actinomycetales bacterium]